MDAKTIVEIVNKLVGDINPAGESHIDEVRFENLKIMCEVTESLLHAIDNVAYVNKKKHEASCKKAGIYAHDFIYNFLGIHE